MFRGVGCKLCAAMPRVSACLGGNIAGGPARVTFVCRRPDTASSSNSTVFRETPDQLASARRVCVCASALMRASKERCAAVASGLVEKVCRAIEPTIASGVLHAVAELGTRRLRCASASLRS